jgi:hypothetical protein
MVDLRPFQRMSEATDQVAYSLRDTQQTMADHLIALQQANLKFTQKNFSNWIELVTEQFKSIGSNRSGPSKRSSCLCCLAQWNSPCISSSLRFP